MKKLFLIFPLIFILAACAGGGNPGTPETPKVPTEPEIPTEPEVPEYSVILESNLPELVRSIGGTEIGFTDYTINYDTTNFHKISDEINSISERTILYKKVNDSSDATAEIAGVSEIAWVDIFGLKGLVTGTNASGNSMFEFDTLPIESTAETGTDISLATKAAVDEFNNKIQERIDNQNEVFLTVIDSIYANLVWQYYKPQSNNASSWFNALLPKDATITASDLGFSMNGKRILDKWTLEKLGYQWMLYNGTYIWKTFGNVANEEKNGISLLTEYFSSLLITSPDEIETIKIMALEKAGGVSIQYKDTEHFFVEGKAGLRYATFGYYRKIDHTVDNGDIIASDSTVDVFYGNDDVDSYLIGDRDDLKNMLVSRDDPRGAILFSGKTVANLTVGNEQADLVGTASLNISGLSQGNASAPYEKLVLDFGSDWYNVEIDNLENSTAKLVYQSSVKSGFGLTPTGIGFSGAGDKMTISDNGVEIKYFGNENYTEAAGSYHLQDNGAITNEHFKLQGAFGVKTEMP
ncbi:MAG: hypothetical protein FWG80_00585 [Alphaproteobacteria bacterium]|nr:hypothetical protein [Alphaproteobacteria bacterium]